MAQNIERMLSSRDLKTFLYSSSSELMPAGVLHWESRLRFPSHTPAQEHLVIWQRPPRSQLIYFHDYWNNEKYLLNLPYTIWFVYVTVYHSHIFLKYYYHPHSWLFFSPTPITGDEQPLFRACLPNVDTSGSVCWGSQGPPTYLNSLGQILIGIETRFFSSMFNDDLSGSRQGNPFFAENWRTLLSQWEKLSPEEVVALDFDLVQTIAQLLASRS